MRIRRKEISRFEPLNRSGVSVERRHLRKRKFAALCRDAATSKGIPVLGAGLVSAAGNSIAEVAAAFRSGGPAATLFPVPAISPTAQVKVLACGEFGAEQFIEPAKRRKLSRIQQMTLVAARKALGVELIGATAPENICAVIGTGLGSLTDTAAFVENLILKDERSPRPALFTSSVHNSLASQVAIELKLAGLNSTPVQREISFETALWQGANELASGRADLALVGAADELNQYHLAAGMRWGWWNKTSPRALPGEGCALFTLGRAETAAAPLAFVSAIRIGRNEKPDAAAEAKWILETLERDGIAPGEVDLLLTGANGVPAQDEFYDSVAAEFSQRIGHAVLLRDYQHVCGEHHSASAFGFLTAIGLVRGEIAAERACKTVVLLTLSSTGTKGMCCLRA